MGTIHLPQDFREFFQSLNRHGVKYLLVGGYAVGYHGYPRATMDINVWVESTPENARRVVEALEDFGFGGEVLSEELFLKDDQIIRMGLPPMRIEIMTSISGVEFGEAYDQRIKDELDGVQVNLISLRHLKVNKVAAARAKDLADLEELP
jgi:predicted nucleotidyltransferase